MSEIGFGYSKAFVCSSAYNHKFTRSVLKASAHAPSTPRPLNPLCKHDDPEKGEREHIPSHIRTLTPSSPQPSHPSPTPPPHPSLHTPSYPSSPLTPREVLKGSTDTNPHKITHKKEHLKMSCLPGELVQPSFLDVGPSRCKEDLVVVLQ